MTELTRGPKTIVLCFDGTADQYGNQNTNVVRLMSMLVKDAPDRQIVYYQAGIGTYFQPGVVAPVLQWCAKILDEAFAWYLYAHVSEGYQFLMQNYMTGDRICLFGFSRGAYTARALAGFLHQIGLLPKDNVEQIPFAYNIYSNTSKASLQEAAGFKSTFCRSVKVDFVGVWETVAAVGVIMTRTLPFTGSNETIKTFRQALALDEHRVRFIPSLYPRPSPNPCSDPNKDSCPIDAPADQQPVFRESQLDTPPNTKHAPAHANGAKSAANGAHPPVVEPRRHFWQRKAAARQKTNGVATATAAGNNVVATPVAVNGTGAATEPYSRTDVLQVWFSGCHSDVGGGETTDDAPTSLAYITLRWMVREAVNAQCGIIFDAEALESMGVSTTPTPSPLQASPQELAEDKNDALAGLGIHDELKKIPLWWLLEILPMLLSQQQANGKWTKKWTVHLGRGRDITSPKPNFHISVKERMADPALKYTPKAKWVKGTEVYVE